MEREKDPDYHKQRKKEISQIVRHHYPPDQFMTKQTAQPSEKKEIPTNLYVSSEQLLTDFLTASKLAEDIRRNKDLPADQRKPISELLPAVQWSTRGNQAVPTMPTCCPRAAEPTTQSVAAGSAAP